MNLQDKQDQLPNVMMSGLTVRSGLRAGNTLDDIGNQLKSWWDNLVNAVPTNSSTTIKATDITK